MLAAIDRPVVVDRCYYHEENDEDGHERDSDYRDDTGSDQYSDPVHHIPLRIPMQQHHQRRADDHGAADYQVDGFNSNQPPEQGRIGLQRVEHAEPQGKHHDCLDREVQPPSRQPYYYDSEDQNEEHLQYDVTNFRCTLLSEGPSLGYVVDWLDT